jgi:ubiquinone/menaquinone biosynthesis C-methylase UbiE
MTTSWFKFWNESEGADKLDRVFNVEKNVAHSILNQLNARKNNILVEFGSGKGELLSHIENSVELPVGIDFSENRRKDCKTKRTEYLINDSFNVDIRKESVDRVFCFSLFNFLTLEETVATIEEMYRITKKDGFILFGDILKEDYEKLFHFKLRDEEINCPRLNFNNEKTITRIVDSVISEESRSVCYNTKFGHPNDDMSFNVLVWKK